MNPQLKIRQILSPNSGVHAVLFYSADLDAAEAAGIALARGWLCLSPVEGGACSVCRSCVAFARNNHVDYKVVAPKGASSIIKLSQVTYRAPDKEEEPEQPLQEFFRTGPLLGKRKVTFIKRADRMNGPASNSLLKALEEPHPYAKLILTASSLTDLLPTILSRCATIPIDSGDPTPPGEAEHAVERIAARTLRASPAEAMLLSENLREAAGLFGVDGVRAAQALAVRELASAFLRLAPERPGLAQATIEVHRRIVGNGAAALNFDALFTLILS